MFHLLLMVHLDSEAREQPHHKCYLNFIDIPKLVMSGLGREEPGEKISKHPEVSEGSLRI